MNKKQSLKDPKEDRGVAIYFRISQEVADKIQKMADKEIDCTLTRFIRINTIKLAK